MIALAANRVYRLHERALWLQLEGWMGEQRKSAARGDVYRLGYRWLIDGPIETVYHFVSHGRTYPEWFPVFRDAQSDDDEVRIGARVRYHVKALLPYHLYWDVRVTRLEPPYLVETDTTVSLSDRFRLGGWVRFTLRACAGRVEVLNEQEMVSEQSLPGPLHALAARAFAFNHDQAMAGGGRGLQRAVSAAVAAGQAAAMAPTGSQQG